MNNSYFYPTQPGWFEALLAEWKGSGKRTLSFPFLEFHPRTLPENRQLPFWMYLYFSEARTIEPTLSRAVLFRVRVIAWSDAAIIGSDAHARDDFVENAKVWFQCDLVEEIRTASGGYLRDSDFRHAKGFDLLSAIRTSIAPVERVSPMVTVQSTWHCPHD